MLNWLNTTSTPEKSDAPLLRNDSGEVRDCPIFPVSRKRETPENTNREAANPRGYEVFPVSRFSRFQNEGVTERTTENEHGGAGKTGQISRDLPGLLDAVAALLTPEEGQEIRAMATTQPEAAAELCRLILAAPPYPSAEDAAELDRLILRLCNLEPWLIGYQTEMLAARRDMAPANYAGELASFRRWVHEAEARHGAGPVGAGDGNPSAL